jgi:hypothetical protein
MRYVLAAALIGFGVYGMPAMNIGSGAFSMPASEARYVADLYRGIAKVLVIDKAKKLSDTDRFRTFHQSCLQMAIKAESVGKYPGLEDFIEKTFADQMGGTEVQPIDNNTRPKLVEACEKIAKKLDGL